MALVISQVAATTAAGPLCTLPPGPCEVTITNTNATAADIIYVGETSTVTATTGMPVLATQTLKINGYPGSKGTALFVIAVASTTVGIMISTPQ